MRLKMAVAAGVMGVGAMIAQGQMNMGSGPAAPAVGTKVSPSAAIEPLLSLWEMEFMGVARAMPADKYDFKPMTSMIAGSKYDGVRSFAEEVKHVTQANFYFYSAASGMKSPQDLKAIGQLKTKEEIVAALEASFAFAHKAVASLTLDDAFTAIKPVDGMTTPIALMSFGAAHGYDHYGQMVEYLRMNGILPPGSK